MVYGQHPKRFESYGWHVVPDVNGHDPVAIQAAIEAAKKVQDKPTLICCKTVIGMGSPNKANTSHVHGAALGNDEIAAARPHIGWNYLPFEIPQEVYDAWDARAKGQALESAWNSMFAEYGKNIRQKPLNLPAAWLTSYPSGGLITLRALLARSMPGRNHRDPESITKFN